MKKPLKSLKLFISTCLLSLATASSQATIIDHGSYFSDTNSGLDWLDVTASVNRSYNDVFSHLGLGGDFVGWRFASSTEFNALLANWTGISTNTTGRTITTGTSPSVDGLVILFGSTLDSKLLSTTGQTWDSARGFAEGEGIDFTLGMLSDLPSNIATQRQVAAIWDNESNGSPLDFYNASHRQVFTNSINGDIGSFLVRQNSSTGNNPPGSATSVDEPGTLVLLALGLFGISMSRKLRNRKQLH